MDRDRNADGDVREFRVEGLGLYILGAAFLVALAGAFFLGRWVERGSDAGGAGAIATDATAPSEGESGEAPGEEGVEVTYFDTLGGEEKAAEPDRQALPDQSQEVPTATEQPAEPPPAPAKQKTEPTPREPSSQGPFFVQVFAGRDRDSATRIVEALEKRGFRGRLDSQTDAEGRLYKVRVGGYPTDREARVAAEELRQLGYDGSWVTRID